LRLSLRLAIAFMPEFDDLAHDDLSDIQASSPEKVAKIFHLLPRHFIGVDATPAGILLLAFSVGERSKRS
jgi:hypothetical protein